MFVEVLALVDLSGLSNIEITTLRKQESVGMTGLIPNPPWPHLRRVISFLVLSQLLMAVKEVLVVWVTPGVV